MPRAVPIIASEAPGNYLTGALWNANIKAMGDWLMGSASNGVPRFRARQSTAQSIPDGTWTSLTLDTEDWDSDNGHSPTTNSSRYTIQVPGTYLVIGSVGYTANVTGPRAVRIALTGSPIPGSFFKTPASPSGNSHGMVTCTHVVCDVGDYLEVQASQTSGGALNTNPGTDVCSSLGAHWISG